MSTEERGTRREKDRQAIPPVCSRSTRSRLPAPRSRLLTPRPGVTLIELLVTIMIIGILAAAVLGVAAVAGETAREAKTKTIVSRLHSLLMEQYDTYANRRVKLNSNVLQEINNKNVNVATKGRWKAEARLYALREMMLMEIPDRWNDVYLADLSASQPGQPVYYWQRTELSNLYLRRYEQLRATQSTAKLKENERAECLYMVIMNACGDGEARTLFPESNIGDTDGDGAPEFIDGWGHPIEFIRWAPGFESDIQFNANELDNPPSPATVDEAWANAGASDHDPFDLYRAQPVSFRLVPLIYSLGRDEEAGLFGDTNTPSWPPMPLPPLNLETNFGAGPPYVKPDLEPHARRTGSYQGASYTGYLGTAIDPSAVTDNITNHLISTRP